MGLVPDKKRPVTIGSLTWHLLELPRDCTTIARWLPARLAYIGQLYRLHPAQARRCR
jgi:hypothetical protein